jgi:hypothetical protein
MAEVKKPRIIVGISGASGAVYGIEALRLLRTLGGIAVAFGTHRAHGERHPFRCYRNAAGTGLLPVSRQRRGDRDSNGGAGSGTHRRRGAGAQAVGEG